MIIFNAISGEAVATPAAGTSTIYLNTSGQVVVKHPDATVQTIGGQKLQTLPDVAGVFTSGQVPIWNGTNWIPGAPSAAIALTPTVVSSGQMMISVVLDSGVIPNGGTPTTITWSGIDQSYDWLEIRGMCRATVSATTPAVQMEFNGDITSGNYITRRMQVNLAGGPIVAAYDVPYVGWSQSSNNFNSNAGDIAPFNVFVPHYATPGNRRWAYTVGAVPISYQAGSVGFDMWSMQWENATGVAVNMIRLRCSSDPNTFTSGTSLQLIGHKRQWVVMSGIIPSGPGISHGFLTP